MSKSQGKPNEPESKQAGGLAGQLFARFRPREPAPAGSDAKSSGRPDGAGSAGVAKAAPGEKSASAAPRPDGWRETIESVVVAFVLAFLFRTFEAEAFVIPTGSMAPTLFGQHRDIYCEQCGTRFAVGASSGTAPDAEVRTDKDPRTEKYVTYISSGERTNFAVCPNANCRFPNDVLAREIFAGDRILVNKFPYEFADPERFDVVVFKFPEGAKTNYIKRLVGMPGEQVRLEGGDVKVRKIDGEDEVYRIARKKPEQQRMLQIPVHDNDRPARKLLAAGWPEAWAPEGGADWSADYEARTFRIDPDPLEPDVEHWLRYANYNPGADDWTRALAGQQILSTPQPQEVRDYYAYNAKITAQEASTAVMNGRLPELSYRDNGSQFVGDLTLNLSVEVLAAEGTVVFELVEGARRYRCTVDLKSGRGSLSYQSELGLDEGNFTTVGDSFETGMNAPETYEVSFANVDDRLCVWVDGRLVKTLEFEEGSRYEPPKPPVLVTERDKLPAGIAARGAKLRIAHLSIERDIYYVGGDGPGGKMDPEGAYRLIDSENDAEDEFLMLGDNSPRSNDSRLWSKHPVARRLLIGRAFFIYWPHGIPFLNGGKGYALGNYYERDETSRNARVPLPRMSAPFYPQVGRWQFIR